MAFPYLTEANVKELIKKEKSESTQFAKIRLTKGIEGEENHLSFILQVVEGSVRVGDEIQIAVMRHWKHSDVDDARHKHDAYKACNLFRMKITKEMIEHPLYRNSKIIMVSFPFETSKEIKKLARTNSPMKQVIDTDGNTMDVRALSKFKIIRIRRPIIKNGQDVGATFSNDIKVRLAIDWTEINAQEVDEGEEGIEQENMGLPEISADIKIIEVLN